MNDRPETSLHNFAPGSSTDSVMEIFNSDHAHGIIITKFNDLEINEFINKRSTFLYYHWLLFQTFIRDMEDQSKGAFYAMYEINIQCTDGYDELYSFINHLENKMKILREIHQRGIVRKEKNHKK